MSKNNDDYYSEEEDVKEEGIVIRGISKPKNCGECRFNDSSCFCSITKVGIDRDYMTTEDGTCPIEDLHELNKKIERLELQVKLMSYTANMMD